jgi:hypothetical protein
VSSWAVPQQSEQVTGLVPSQPRPNEIVRDHSLELGIDRKAIVEETRPPGFLRCGEQPSMDEGFSPHDDGRATSE